MLRMFMSLFGIIVFTGIARSDAIDPAKGKLENGVRWFDIRLLGVEGQGWKDTSAPFDRFPGRAEKTVRPAVWSLSRDSAGLAVRFVSDSPNIQARWTLTKANLAMPHMPATGVSGLDLYIRDPKTKKWKWLGVGQPRAQTNTATLASGVPAGSHEYLLYLPLYNGVSAVEIGVVDGRSIQTAPPYAESQQKPIVFYGTSITQGGCASRPGMVHTAIIGRKLERPVINLGFSGNGKMEDAVVDLIQELDAAAYVIDCLPNMNAAEVTERTAPLVRKLRAKHPTTPIVLVEDRSYANSDVLAGPKNRNDTNRAALQAEWKKLQDAGVKGLYLIRGDTLIGDDGEGTVDSSHPTDLGFLRQAEAFLEVLAPLMPQSQSSAIIEGYTDQLSYLPGSKVGFHLSSTAMQADIEISRLGAERVTVHTQKAIPVTKQVIPSDASAQGCRWPETVAIPVGKDWKSGYYIAKLTVNADGSGKPTISEIPFIVRSSHPGRDSKILLQLATNTYNAYTNWGGYSLYAYHGRYAIQGRRVSFDRPISSQFNNWEYPFVQWAERNGYTLDYAANSDLEFHPDLLKHYRLVLSVGHDEYWSSPMRDHLEAFIREGGNVAFLSGNTCCWQVRSEAGGRALACWKQAFRYDPNLNGDLPQKQLSTLWSHHRVGRPENQLTGVGFLWGGYHRSHGQFMDGPAAFRVHRPDHWLFQGTQLKTNDSFGGKDTIVGYECDGCELSWRDGLPYPTGRDGTPTAFTVLATCPARWHPADCEWYERWEKGRTGHAVLGTYTQGGTVVSVGTTDWAHGLRGNDPTVVQITKNILDKLGK